MYGQQIRCLRSRPSLGPSGAPPSPGPAAPSDRGHWCRCHRWSSGPGRPRGVGHGGPFGGDHHHVGVAVRDTEFDDDLDQLGHFLLGIERQVPGLDPNDHAEHDHDCADHGIWSVFTGAVIRKERRRECRPQTSPTGGGVREFRAIGTSASVVVAQPELADLAQALLAEDLYEVDAAYSRFRSDSELRRLEDTSGGHPVRVSSTLYEALAVARAVAVKTVGIVDPTIGSALIELGYDRDFNQLDPLADLPIIPPSPAPGWWRIVLDPDRRTVMIPVGVHVDLGSSGKAFAADKAAQHLASELECGVLVNLGGDVSVSGPAPIGGWPIGIATSCTTPTDAVDQVVTIVGGGLATSGTTSRSWSRGGRRVHHIVDPWTGDAAPSIWSLVSATGPSCVEANAWSTAAVVWGEDAPDNLEAEGVSARLVRDDGSVLRVGGWPDSDLHGHGATPELRGP